MAKDNKTDILNLNMQEMVEALQETARHNSDVNLKIAVLAHNTDCHWLTENGSENVIDSELDILQKNDLSAFLPKLALPLMTLSVTRFLLPLTSAI